jgi:hypothetical protein
MEEVVVAMVTTNDEAELPFTETDAGDTLQVAEDGAPLQLNVTVPLNPPIGTTCKLYFVVCPALTVAEVEQFPPAGQLPPVATPSEKSVAVPESETVCGLPTALSVIVRVPARSPPAVGAKLTWVRQLAPAATEPAQLLVSEKSLLAVVL